MTRTAIYMLLSFSVTLFISCGSAQKEAVSSQNNNVSQQQSPQPTNFQSSYDPSALVSPNDGSTLISGAALDSLEAGIEQNPLGQQDLGWTPQPEAPATPGLFDGLFERIRSGDGLFSRFRNR